MECWDAHVPLYNHRESWALENRSPKVLEAESPNPSRPKKDLPEREKFIQGIGIDDKNEEEEETTMTDGNAEKEVLVVASKLKNYIRAKSGMNTSAAVTDVLSDKIRELCDQAIETAKKDGRKTVMDRDFG